MRIFVCWEKTIEDASAKQVCRPKCFLWVTNVETIHGEVLPNCFLPTHRPTIEVEAFLQWWLAFKQHNTNQKFMQTGWFQTDLAVYLWDRIKVIYYWGLKSLPVNTVCDSSNDFIGKEALTGWDFKPYCNNFCSTNCREQTWHIYMKRLWNTLLMWHVRSSIIFMKFI